MLEVLGDKVREEEIVEGMQAEKEEEHEHPHHHEGEEAEEHHHHHHDDEEEIEYDEHVLLSLNNAIVVSKSLCKEICKIDGANSAVYEKILQLTQKNFPFWMLNTRLQ